MSDNDPRALKRNSPNVLNVNFDNLFGSKAKEDAAHIEAWIAMSDEWGTNCPDFDPDCFQCQAWKLYEESNHLHVPTSDEVMEATNNNQQ